MDELERELKQIQLQRERLALKRELERSKWKENTIANIGRGLFLGNDVSHAAVGGLARFVKRWWKLALVIALIGPAIVGGLLWRASVLQARLEIEQAKYQQDIEDFVTLKCPNVTCSSRDPNYYLSTCLDERILEFQGRESCESKARSIFYKVNGASPSR